MYLCINFLYTILVDPSSVIEVSDLMSAVAKAERTRSPMVDGILPQDASADIVKKKIKTGYVLLKFSKNCILLVDAESSIIHLTVAMQLYGRQDRMEAEEKKLRQ